MPQRRYRQHRKERSRAGGAATIFCSGLRDQFDVRYLAHFVKINIFTEGDPAESTALPAHYGHTLCVHPLVVRSRALFVTFLSHSSGVLPSHLYVELFIRRGE